MAAAAVALGGSAKAQRPSKTRPASSSASTRARRPDQGRDATAMLRKPVLGQRVDARQAHRPAASSIAAAPAPARCAVHKRQDRFRRALDDQRVAFGPLRQDRAVPAA